MEDIQEAFTRRMLRRVTSRRNRDRDGVSDTGNEDSQRRCNILKAIDDPSAHRGSYADTENRDKFDRSNDPCDKSSNWIENSCDNNNTAFLNKFGKDIIEKSPVYSPNGSTFAYYEKPLEMPNTKWHRDKSSSNLPQIDDEEMSCQSEKVRVREPSIQSSPTMTAYSKNLDIENPISDIFAASNLTRVTESSVGSLSAAIDELDEQIKLLEMRSPNAFTTEAIIEKHDEKLYPVLENMEFECIGHTPQKSNCTRDKDSRSTELIFSEEINEDNNTNEAEITRPASYAEDNSDELVMYHRTPKSARKMPIMESSRKCSHSDSTRIKFSSLSRVESTISSIPMLATPGSTDYKYGNGNGDQSNEIAPNLNDTVPYDVDRFLEDALGDELYNTTVTYAASENRDQTNSHFNASELISEDGTPLRKRLIRVLRPPMTEPTPRNSSTLNRSMSMYRSLSQRIKKKFRTALKTKEDISPPPLIPSGARESDGIRELLREISVQQTLVNQATKALNVCHTMKEFMESSERIESERLLLVAGLRRRAAMEEIKRLTRDESRNADNDFFGDKGEITIKDVKLNLRECLRREAQEGETTEWFVVVVFYGVKVWATRAISAPINDSRIHFSEAISIPNLTPNFKILVEIYSLKLRRSTYNHEEKYRIHNKLKRSGSCPPFFVSPTKILKKVERPLSPKIAHNRALKNRTTSFALCGIVEFFLRDLSLSSPWPLILVPDNSILQGTIEASLSCKLRLSASHEGFLNHGDETGGFAIWNRRWCVLKGHTLMFWNYPREQETKDPLTIIELINCVSKEITTADRTICAKPRTLLIETASRTSAESCTIVRNLLSCDSVRELTEWSTKLNRVIFALREWNVIDPRPRPQLSEL